MTSILAIDPGNVASPSVAFDVRGIPAPKGSSRAILVRGRAVNVTGGSDVNKRAIKAWTKAVAIAGEKCLDDAKGPLFRDAALTVAIVFRLTRPVGHWRKGKYGEALKPSASAFPSVKPDVDKLARATLDALTGIVWDDDSRIVVLSVAKVYAALYDEGASIRVRLRSTGDADLAAIEAAP